VLRRGPDGSQRAAGGADVARPREHGGSRAASPPTPAPRRGPSADDGPPSSQTWRMACRRHGHRAHLWQAPPSPTDFLNPTTPAVNIAHRAAADRPGLRVSNAIDQHR
jgi:hypothetical protein